MQFENTNVCIVSGPIPIPKRKNEPDSGEKNENGLGLRPPKLTKPVFPKAPGGAFASMSRPLRAYVGLWRNCGRRAAAMTAAICVTAAGLAALGSYCTIGVDYYNGGRLLCTVAASDDAAAIIGDAARLAEDLGAPEPRIETSAKLTLKSRLVDGEEAINAILAASPYLCRGYVASVNGTELFTAPSRKVIDEAIEAYIQKYRINDSAALSASIEVADKIVRSDSVSEAGEIADILENSDALTVVNTVDITEQLPIAHEVSEISDDSMYVGESVVETEGVDGVMVTVNEQIYSNGELLSSAIISSETASEPVTEVVRVGTKPRNALTDGLSYPVSARLSSGFGQRWGRQHRGIDLAVSMNTPVAAAASGTVITAEYKSSYGNMVQIDHGYGIVTTYAHLNSIGVSVGQSVVRGETVGKSGSTGNSTGPHLHFEVILNGEYLNPLDHLIAQPKV